MPSTPFAYSSVHTSMSWWRWTQPLGKPVLPDEYSQNAASSLLVGSASSSAEPCWSSSSKSRSATCEPTGGASDAPVGDSGTPPSACEPPLGALSALAGV